jgi:hypothetical protein
MSTNDQLLLNAFFYPAEATGGKLALKAYNDSKLPTHELYAGSPFDAGVSGAFCEAPYICVEDDGERDKKALCICEMP